MVQLYDGRVVVSVMDEGCPAEEKGLKWGAEIIRWNELPVLTAIDQVPYKWVSPMSCSTLESLNLRKTLYLAHAPLNRSVSVTFRNPDEIEERVITLTSYDDSAVALKETKPLGYPLPERYVEWSILPNGYGYLKISGEIPTPSLINPVAMLISNNTGSTGEGFPLIMQSLNRGPVLGFYGTNGSFGMIEGSVQDARRNSGEISQRDGIGSG